MHVDCVMILGSEANVASLYSEALQIISRIQGPVIVALLLRQRSGDEDELLFPSNPPMFCQGIKEKPRSLHGERALQICRYHIPT